LIDLDASQSAAAGPVTNVSIVAGLEQSAGESRSVHTEMSDSQQSSSEVMQTAEEILTELDMD